MNRKGYTLDRIVEGLFLEDAAKAGGFATAAYRACRRYRIWARHRCDSIRPNVDIRTLTNR